MNTRELHERLKGRSRPENEAKAANRKLDVVKAAVGVSWFVALGRFCSVVAQFFRDYGQYLFLLSLFFSFVSWIISTVEYADAGNKNRGKTANFLYSTFHILFYTGIVVGFAIGGILIGMPMLFVSMFFDPVINLARAIYFGIKSALTDKDDPEKGYFFKNRALNHGAFALVGTMISVAFVLLMIFTVMPLGWAVAIGIAGIGVMVGAVFLVPKIVSWLTGPKPQVLGPFLVDDTSDQELRLLPEQQVSPGYYYDNTLTTAPASLAALIDEINAHIRKIEGDFTRDEGTFLESIWSQSDKRRNKISALEFLKVIINDEALAAIPDEASEQQKFQLAGYLFHYKDKIELCEKISELVVQKYPGAFQSFNKEVGDVEACFNRLFLCIIEDNDLLNRVVPKERDDEYSLRSAHAF